MRKILKAQDIRKTLVDGAADMGTVTTVNLEKDGRYVQPLAKYA